MFKMKIKNQKEKTQKKLKTKETKRKICAANFKNIQQKTKVNFNDQQTVVE